jgi:hypothetical protein
MELFVSIATSGFCYFLLHSIVVQGQGWQKNNSKKETEFIEN